jgi:hypothetical protein
MRSLILKIFAAVLLVSTLAGCAGVRQESAMEWMQRQPWTSDSPT